MQLVSLLWQSAPVSASNPAQRAAYRLERAEASQQGHEVVPPPPCAEHPLLQRR